MVENISKKSNSSQKNGNGFPDQDAIFYEFKQNSEWEEGWDTNWVDQEKSNPLVGLEENMTLLPSEAENHFSQDSTSNSVLTQIELTEFRTSVENTFGVDTVSAINNPNGLYGDDKISNNSEGFTLDLKNSAEDIQEVTEINSEFHFQSSRNNQTESDSHVDIQNSALSEEIAQEKNNGSSLRYRKSKISKTSAGGFDHQDFQYSQLSLQPFLDSNQHHRNYSNLNPYGFGENLADTYHVRTMLEEFRLNELNTNSLNASKYSGSTEKELKLKEKSSHLPLKSAKSSPGPVTNMNSKNTSRWPFSVLHTVQANESPKEINCERCSSKFFSYYNYRRHFRSHNKTLHHEKETVHGLRDKLISYFAKLDAGEVISLISIEEMSIENNSGTDVLSHFKRIYEISNGVKKLNGNIFSSSLYFMQLLDKKQTKSADLFFSELDKATEGTFLIGEISSPSLRKYLCEKNDKFILNENANMSALFAFMIEQKLVERWAVEQKTLALNVHRALMEEEDEKFKKLAKIQKKKRHKKMRFKKWDKKESESNEMESSSDELGESTTGNVNAFEGNEKSNVFMLLNKDIVFEDLVIPNAKSKSKEVSEKKRSLLSEEYKLQAKEMEKEKVIEKEKERGRPSSAKEDSFVHQISNMNHSHNLLLSNVHSNAESIIHHKNENRTSSSLNFKTHTYKTNGTVLNVNNSPYVGSMHVELQMKKNIPSIASFDGRKNVAKFGKGKQRKKYLWEKKIKEEVVMDSSSIVKVDGAGAESASSSTITSFSSHPVDKSHDDECLVGSSNSFHSLSNEILRTTNMNMNVSSVKDDTFSQGKMNSKQYLTNSKYSLSPIPSFESSQSIDNVVRTDSNVSSSSIHSAIPLMSSSLSQMPSPTSKSSLSLSIVPHALPSDSVSVPIAVISLTSQHQQESKNLPINKAFALSSSPLSPSLSPSSCNNKYSFGTNLKHKQKKRYQRKEYSPFSQPPTVRSPSSKRVSKIYPVDDAQLIPSSPSPLAMSTSSPPFTSPSSFSSTSSISLPPPATVTAEIISAEKIKMETLTKTVELPSAAAKATEEASSPTAPVPTEIASTLFATMGIASSAPGTTITVPPKESMKEPRIVAAEATESIKTEESTVTQVLSSNIDSYVFTSSIAVNGSSEFSAADTVVESNGIGSAITAPSPPISAFATDSRSITPFQGVTSDGMPITPPPPPLPPPHTILSTYAFHPVVYSTPTIVPTYPRVLPSAIHPIVYPPSNPSYPHSTPVLFPPRPYMMSPGMTNVFYPNHVFKPSFIMHSNASSPILYPSRPPLPPSPVPPSTQPSKEFPSSLPSQLGFYKNKVSYHFSLNEPSPLLTDYMKEKENEFEYEKEKGKDKGKNYQNSTESSNKEMKNLMSEGKGQILTEFEKEVNEIALSEKNSEGETGKNERTIQDAFHHYDTKEEIEKEKEMEKENEEGKVYTIDRGNSPVFMVGSFAIPLYNLPSNSSLPSDSSLPSLKKKKEIYHHDDNDDDNDDKNGKETLEKDEDVHVASQNAPITYIVPSSFASSPLPSSPSRINEFTSSSESSIISFTSSESNSFPSPNPSPSPSAFTNIHVLKSYSKSTEVESMVFHGQSEAKVGVEGCNEKEEDEENIHGENLSPLKLEFCNQCPLCVKRLKWERENQKNGRKNISYVQLMTQRWNSFNGDIEEPDNENFSNLLPSNESKGKIVKGEGKEKDNERKKWISNESNELNAEEKAILNESNDERERNEYILKEKGMGEDKEKEKKESIESNELHSNFERMNKNFEMSGKEKMKLGGRKNFRRRTKNRTN